MKKSLFAALLLALCLCLCSCKSADYDKAMEHFEAGNYEAARDAFTALADYEDSSEMVKKCDYQMAAALMEEENYQEALTRFQTLGDYEDSAEMVLQCRYALAETALEARDFETALEGFTELGTYRDSADRRQEAAWRTLHAYIETKGEPLSYVHKSTKEQVITTDLSTVPTNPDQLILYNSNLIKVMGLTHFGDLSITITRGNPEAKFQSSTELDGLGTESYTSGDGNLNISSATSNTQLNPNNYLYFYTDIYGKSHSETEMDATNRAALQEHYTYMLQGIAAILSETGLPVTMADLGFDAMG